MSSRSESQARTGQVTEPKQTKQDAGVKPRQQQPAVSGGRGGGGRGGGRRRRDYRDHLGAGGQLPGGRRPYRGGEDKRPQPRGDKTWQDRGPVMEDDEAEVGSVFNAGSKKQSLNHLLNFQYGNSPRRGSGRGFKNGNNNNYNYNNSGNRGNRSRNNTVSRTTYKKEHYLQANCQFVVSNSGDYSLHKESPDILVNWDLVEQVLLKTCSSSPQTCPICLYPPVSGRVSRCGHIFCWPCILHYLALSDETWRKCPICYDKIQKSDLRSVRVVQQTEFGTGAEIQMSLMKRDRHSLTAVPVSAGVAGEVFPSLAEENDSFCKLILASPGDVADRILARERRQLERQMEEERHLPESCFIEEALGLLAEREQQLAMTMMMMPGVEGEVVGVRKEEDDLLPPIEQLKMTHGVEEAVDPFREEKEEEDLPNLDDMIQLSAEREEAVVAVVPPSGGRHRRDSSSSEGSSGVEEDLLLEEAVVTAEDLDIDVREEEDDPGRKDGGGAAGVPKTTFYFYQSSDGQPIFLHALNVQMLMEEYGGLERCPATITATILEKDSAVMTEGLRDRLRYLRHLPLASSFDVAELALREPVVGRRTMAKFREQVDARRRKRARRSRDERRREKRILAEERRQLGWRADLVRIESGMGREPPSSFVKSREEEPGLSADDPPLSGGDDRERHVSRGSDVSSGSQENSSTPSFAKMLREGARRAPAPAPRPAPTTGVLGVMVPLGPNRQQAQPRQHQQGDSEPEPEEWVPPPPVASLGDTLAAALENHQPQKRGKKGKGKRGKQILLSCSSARPIS